MNLPAASAAVRPLIVASLREVLAERGVALPAEVAGDLVLFGGPGAALDSLALVNFIADLEARLGAAHGTDLVLADERTMSRGRSPFRTLDAVVEHVAQSLAA